MFSLRRPKPNTIRRYVERAREMPGSYGIALNTQSGPEELLVPKGYHRDHLRAEIGRGAADFQAAREALRQWRQFDLGWVRIANPEARLVQDEILAIEAHSLGLLWSVNCSRILYVIDEPDRFGFGYGTTPLHVQRGEERFLLEFYPISGAVFYELLAVSQPAHWLAKLGLLYTRSQQHRFARESQLRMKQAVAELTGNVELPGVPRWAS